MMADVHGHISLRGVTKIFPGHQGHANTHALGPIDLDIARGEFFSVVGPSGCGKSTLLDILSGLATATSGITIFDGQVLAGAVPDGIGAPSKTRTYCQASAASSSASAIPPRFSTG